MVQRAGSAASSFFHLNNSFWAKL